MNNTQLATTVDAIMEAQQTFTEVKSPLDFEREKYFALQICEGNNALCKVGMLPSLAHAVRNVALIGITLNPAMKLAYLVPRDGRVCLDISYMGLTKIATDSGSVIKVNCQLVCENDFFEVEHGTNESLTHKPKPFIDRGAVIGVYCVAHLHDGGAQIETMSLKEVYEIRARSKAYASGKSCPWLTDEGEMIRKTCVKRSSKYWPKTERLATAIMTLDDHEGYRDIGNDDTLDTPANEEEVHYCPADFEEFFPNWSKIIKAGQRTAQEVIDTVNSDNSPLSPEQEERLRKVETPIEGEVVT